MQKQLVVENLLLKTLEQEEGIPYLPATRLHEINILVCIIFRHQEDYEVNIITNNADNVVSIISIAVSTI